MSDLHKITTGGPQGYMLGPLIFLLLTNDLPGYLTNNYNALMLFADDTCIAVSVQSRDKLTSSLPKS